MTKFLTERLLLRPLKLDDAKAIVQEINKFEIARNLARVPYPYERKHADEFITWANGVDRKSSICAVAWAATPSALIGIVSYEWNETKQDAELGYWYAESVWGKGVATEAATALVRHAFESAGHPKLVSCYHDDNDASRRVLEKVGFTAVMKCNHFSVAQNREVPTTNMALTRTAWANSWTKSKAGS